MKINTLIEGLETVKGYTIEEIKPVFEYLSITHENKYSDRGIGNGEGLALSYALDVCNMNK